MITRRSFLLGSSAMLGLAFFDQIKGFIQRTGEPLLRVPDQVDCVLQVYPERDFLITMAAHPDEGPIGGYSWHEYLFDLLELPEPQNPSQWQELTNTYGITEDTIYADCPNHIWFDTWYVKESPKADAYHYLEGLDLGPWLSEGSPGGNGLEFDGYYLTANADGPLAVSLLQERLNALSENTEVCVMQG